MSSKACAATVRSEIRSSLLMSDRMQRRTDARHGAWNLNVDLGRRMFMNDVVVSTSRLNVTYITWEAVDEVGLTIILLHAMFKVSAYVCKNLAICWTLN